MGSEIHSTEIEYDEKVDLIGIGTFGKVFRGRCRGVEVAIKVPNKQVLDEEERRKLQQEAHLISINSHPNIVRFMGACTEEGRLLIVTERCVTDLEILLTERRDLELPQRVRFARDIAKGMVWLHNSHPPVIHRDLKPANILVDATYQMKITDFGLAQARDTKMMLDKPRGSLNWAAPEVLQRKLYNEKIDVHSFGIILWQIATRKEPYEHLNTMEDFMKAICEMHERPPLTNNDIPLSLQMLMSRCWAPDPADRPEFREIVFRLNEIITDATIKDTSAAWVWKEEFLLTGHQDLLEVVEWDKFQALLARKLPAISAHELARLRNLIAEPPKRQGDAYLVSMAQYYQFVQWFGAFYDPIKGLPIVREMIALLDAKWFHGCVNRHVANTRITKCAEPGCFLVRLTTTANPLQYPFTITVANDTHYRVERASGFLQGQDGKSYNNISEYVAAHAHLFKVACPQDDSGLYTQPGGNVPPPPPYIQAPGDNIPPPPPPYIQALGGNVSPPPPK